MTVTFIRHGESLANVNPHYYSVPDCANILTQNGVNQCIELSHSIEKYVSSNIIISSEYQRAKVTAQIVTSKFNLPIQIDVRLNEVVHESLGKPIEKRDDVIKRIRSVVENYECDIVLFTHSVLMGMIDIEKGNASYCEVRQYSKPDLLNKYLK